MTSQQYERISEIFAAACERAPAQRAAYLDQVCRDDRELRVSVEALLSHDSAGDFLTTQPVPGALLAAAALAATDVKCAARPDVPETIGRYRVRGVLGEGGMGMVYLAEQDHPHRPVALKVVRPGLMSPQLLRRFEHEAEILGQLLHPGIAQIYEAGTADVTPPGAAQAVRLPFFAMEYVRGEPLLDYAVRQRLGTRQRLELVAKICDAVHHAHQHGVIHRDLKPANILVVEEEGSGFRVQGSAYDRSRSTLNPEPRTLNPKILDFGVARLTHSDVKVTTLQTDVGQLIGTLGYMSPEQVAGDPQQLDARSDVYALGVIAYELLAGMPPFDVRSRSIPEAIRIIREEEPVRLSAIKRVFRGDIETIVFKALEKDTQRRYASAAQLAADIRRYLRDEPILARPASALYHLHKFTRRNKGLVAGFCLGMAALLIGASTATWWALAAENARRGESEQRRIADRTARDARRLAYRASIAAAAAAINVGDCGTARRRLQDAPAELRGWEWGYLAARSEQSLAEISLPDLPWQAWISSDGRVLRAITGDDHIAREWNVDTPAATLAARDNWRSNVLAQNGAIVVRLLGNGRIEIQDETSGAHRTAHLAEWGLPSDAQLGYVTVRPDGSALALRENTGPERGRLVFVDLQNSEVLRDTAADVNQLRICALSTRDQLAYVIWEEPMIHLWDRATDTVRVLRGHTQPVRALAFSADGSRLFSGGRDNTIGVWNTQTGEQQRVLESHSDAVEALSCSPDGALLASAGADRVIRVWDAQRLELLASLAGHEALVKSLAFRADGRRLVSAAADHTIRLWDPRAPGRQSVLHGHTSFVYPVAYSPNGEIIASGSWDQTIRLWRAADGAPLGTLSGHSAFIKDVLFSPDGMLLASTSDDGSLRVWDVAAQREVARLARTFAKTRSTPCIAFAPGGRIVVAHEPDTGIVAYFDPRGAGAADASSSEPLASLRSVQAAFISPDGKLLATLRTMRPDHFHLELFDLTSDRAGAGAGQPADKSFDVGQTTAFAFNPKPESWKRAAAPGPLLVGGCADDPTTLIVRDARTGMERARLHGHTDQIYACVFSPDGSRIATGGRDQTIRLWDAHTYDELLQLRGHTSYVWSLAFSPDGAQLASGSGDHTVRIWDTRPAETARQAEGQRN